MFFFSLVTICPQRISTNNVQLTNFNQHTLGSLNLLNDMENPGFPICYLSLSIYIIIMIIFVFLLISLQYSTNHQVVVDVT